MDIKQKTLKTNMNFSGIGVHSGQFSKVIVKPADIDTGIVFVNALHSADKIIVGSVVPEAAMHATVIKGNIWSVSTIEHLMAALNVLGIDNAVIEVQGNEIPILDGSALLFVQGILDAGIQELSARKRFLMPKETVLFNDNKGRSLQLSPLANEHAINNLDEAFTVEYSGDFNHPLTGGLTFSAIASPNFFISQLAPARTFGFLEQLPFLRQHNLARGTSLGNSVVIGQELLNDMRFDNECIRHKVLDLLGDLSLLGRKLVGSVIAHKTSHNFNRLVIEHFIQHPDSWKLV